MRRPLVEEQHAFAVESGNYELLIGALSAEIRVTTVFAVR